METKEKGASSEVSQEPKIIGLDRPVPNDPQGSKSMLAMAEDLEANQGSDDPKLNFTFEEFEELLNSVMEVQIKGSREVNGETIRSFPYDMEVELADLLGWMKRKFKPYQMAREKYAESLGLVFDQQRQGYMLRPQPGKIDLTPAMKQEIAIENQKKFDSLTEASNSMNDSQFKFREELFTKRLPLKLFTKERMKESGILLKDVRNVQPFLQYCVSK